MSNGGHGVTVCGSCSFKHTGRMEIVLNVDIDATKPVRETIGMEKTSAIQRIVTVGRLLGIGYTQTQRVVCCTR